MGSAPHLRIALAGFGNSSCKTQYTSVIGDAHLVACHGGLVKLLAHAIALGVSVVVRTSARNPLGPFKSKAEPEAGAGAAPRVVKPAA